MSGEPFIPCCGEGRRHAESFLVLLSTRPSQDRLAAALLDWAEHAIDDHEAGGMADPACSACWAFGQPPQGGLTTAQWWTEGHVHRVVHALGVEALLAHAKAAREIKEGTHDGAADRARAGGTRAAGGR